MIGLRWWRRARGLTQAELAALSGVERSHIGKIERLEVEEPRPHTLLRLAEALGVEVYDLYLGQYALPYFGAPEGLRRGDHEEFTDASPLGDDRTHEAPTRHPTTAAVGGTLER